MEGEKGKKSPNIHWQSTSTMFFLTETIKEQNETQKHISFFQENGKLSYTISEYQIKSQSRAILKSYACQDPNKGGTIQS